MNFLRKIKSWVSKDNNQAVILHLYYIDLWPEFERYLGTLKDFDLYLSLSFTPPESFLQMVRIVFPKTKIFVWSNRGRDILPFLKIFKLIEPLNYRYICKIHSKKSLGRLDYDGACWRRDLLSSLLGSRAQVKKIKKIFSLDAKVGLIVPRDYYWNYQNYVGQNKEKVETMIAKLSLPSPSSFFFPAGSMFWFKPEALKKVLDLNLADDDFDSEEGQFDGTLAHALERLFGLIAESSGFVVKTIK